MAGVPPPPALRRACPPDRPTPGAAAGPPWAGRLRRLRTHAEVPAVRGAGHRGDRAPRRHGGPRPGRPGRPPQSRRAGRRGSSAMAACALERAGGRRRRGCRRRRRLRWRAARHRRRVHHLAASARRERRFPRRHRRRLGPGVGDWRVVRPLRQLAAAGHAAVRGQPRVRSGTTGPAGRRPAAGEPARGPVGGHVRPGRRALAGWATFPDEDDVSVLADLEDFVSDATLADRLVAAGFVITAAAAVLAAVMVQSLSRRQTARAAAPRGTVAGARAEGPGCRAGGAGGGGSAGAPPSLDPACRSSDRGRRRRAATRTRFATSGCETKAKPRRPGPARSCRPGRGGGGRCGR